MDGALAALPLDFPQYDERAETLSVIHDYIDGAYTIFPDQKQDIEVEATGQQLSLFDFMGESVPEKAQESAVEQTEETQTIPETVTEPENTEEKQDAVYTAVEEQVTETMEKAGVSFDVLSPEQVEVIYAAAENGQDITPVLNPEFSP